MTLARFPRRTLRGDAGLYRIHRRQREAWWFSTEGTGRFDPLGTGLGACYLAERPLGAWVEVFRLEIELAEMPVSERALARVRLERDVRLADLTSRRALEFGVTASLGASEDYSESQEFAARAAEAGFGGIRYLVRHDPAQKLYGIALFGEPGRPAAGDPLWPAVEDEPISDELIEQARRAFGYRILPTP